MCRDPQDILPGESDLARGRLNQAANHPRRRRLARAVRAEETDDLSLVDLEREPVQDDRSAVAGTHLL
jgi:hypothetical protein